MYLLATDRISVYDCPLIFEIINDFNGGKGMVLVGLRLEKPYQLNNLFLVGHIALLPGRNKLFSVWITNNIGYNKTLVVYFLCRKRALAA